MPALTVKAITKALSEYVRPDEDIVAKLNFVMPRLYALGMWRDLVYDWSINTTNAYFALPEGAEGLLGSMLNNTPVDAQAQWHDYRVSGYADDGPSPIFGVIDDGWSPSKEDLPLEPEASAYCDVGVRPVAPNTLLPSEGVIRIIAEKYTGEIFTGTFNLDGSALTSFGDDDIFRIHQISFEDVPQEVEVYGVRVAPSADEFTLAVVRGDGVARYRRFRFSNPSAEGRSAKLLLKRAWQPVLVQTDIVHLGNLNAIKHGLLGLLAEDNADLERANYHWAVSAQLLEDELDATRGAAKPKLRLNPSGTSFAIYNAT